MPNGYKRRIGRQIGLSDQRGLSMAVMVAIIVVMGIITVGLFMLSGSGNDAGDTGDTTDQTATDDTATGTEDTGTAASGEPPFIRIPDNSLIYKDATYSYSFAYPSSFEKLNALSTDSLAAGGYTAAAESAMANAKPVGTTGATLSGVLGTYVYDKDEFKILVGNPDIYVSPTKTGNDITWKVISRGNTTQDISIGDAYQVKTFTSQTGVKVFDFTETKAGFSYGRYAFASGDSYVMVTLPVVSLAGGASLKASDLSAYSIIGANIASTVRAKSTAATSSTNTPTDADTDAGTAVE